MNKFLFSLAALTLTTAALAQAPQPCVEPDKHTPSGQKITCAQKFELEALNGRMSALNAMANPIVLRKQQIIMDLEKTNPGFKWTVNQQTGQEFGLQPVGGAQQPPPSAFREPPATPTPQPAATPPPNSSEVKADDKK